MDNLSFVKGIGMPADISLNTRSPHLGERPSDHFQGFQGSLASLFEGERGAGDIMAMLGDILSGLSSEDQASLGEWAKNLTAGASTEQGDIAPILGDVMDKLIAQLEESGMEMQSLEEIKGLLKEGLSHHVTSDSAQLDVNVVSDPSLTERRLRPLEPHQEKKGGEGKDTLGALIKDYVEGYRKIASNYGSPREYTFQEIVVSVSTSWHQSMPAESVIAPLNIIGTGLAEYVSEQYRELGLSSHGRMDSPEKMAGKQDMVLDKQMAQAIITKAMEVLSSDNQRMKENEFTLKVHPRSLGEINVSVTTNRDNVNITIEASQEAADKIKNDIVYFSNKYDNMEWRLNDNEVAGQGSSHGSGSDEGDISIEPLDRSLNHSGIINIII